jgi:hypothetical protein
MWKLPALAVEGGGVFVLVGSEVGSGFVVIVFDDVGFWESTAPFGTCGVALGMLRSTLAGVDEDFVEAVDSEWPEGLSLSLLDLFFPILASGRDQCMENLL